MAKVVKNVSFSWEWTGDERLLQGFNVALCKATETPLTAVTASTFIAMRGTSETPVTLEPSYIFSNVLLDEGVYYIPFVQAVYPGDDSEWLGSTGVLVEDDGTSTVAMDSTLPVVFFQATTPSGKFGDTWVDTDDGNKSYYHNGTSWIEGKYGQDGVNGTRTAILEMYQAAASIPTTFPSGDSTYTWATGQFTAPGTPNSWELTPPALDAGETLWICRTVYADTGTSATTAITWPGTNYARAASSNGADGANGARTAVLEVYRWLPTGTSSFTYPSGSSTYTWATGVFDLPATPNSWSLLPGAATEGYTLFACRVVFTDTLTTATSSVSWAGVTSAYAIGVAGISGVSAVAGILTNESHTVAALGTGLGYSLTTAGGTFKVYSGVTDVTTSSTFSISGGTDGGTSWTKVQNGLTFTINETTGVYSLSGASWTTDSESFTVIGTYGGTAISKVYTISKSIAGAVGAAANVVTVTGEQAFKFLTGSATPVSSSITLTAVLNGSLTTYDWEYWTGSAWANLSGTQNSNTYALAYNNAAWGSATALRVRCLSGTVFDEITVVKLYDGATGPSGNSTYTATIYKQVASDPGSPVATASTYNFATGVLTPPSGWVVVQPATTTTPTYACEYTFSGLPSATVTGSGSWGPTRIDAVAGAAGNGGVSIAVVEMYKVGGGTLPTGTTFTFSTGLVSGTLNGWSQTMPASSTTATYMTTCKFTATAPTDTHVNSSWTTAVVVAQNGAQGIQGPSVIVTANRPMSFTATDGSLDAAQSDIVLTANVTGITSPTYAWTFSGLDSNPGTTNAQTCTITSAQFGTSKSAWAKCTVNGNASYVGTVTIVRLELSTGVPGAGSGVNILNARYSGFEQSTAPTLTPTGCTATVDTVGWRALSTKSLKLAATSGTSYVYFGSSSTDYNLPITAGKKWIVSAWVKCSAASKAGRFYLRTASAGTYFYGTFTTSATPDTWERVSCVINATVDTTSTTAWMAPQHTGGAGVSMWFDDIMMEEQIGSGTTASSYVAPLWSITDQVQTIISGINLPTTGMQTGLNITKDYLGYYNGSAWVSYIDSSGNFKFGDGSSTPGIAWNQSAGTLAIRGALVADDITSGTLTGRTIQTASSGVRTVIYGNDYSDAALRNEIHVYNDIGAGVEEIASIGINSGLGGDYTVGKFGTLSALNEKTGVTGLSNIMHGVVGHSINNTGVYGLSDNSTGVYGATNDGLTGVEGWSQGTAGIGVYGHGLDVNSCGVKGESTYGWGGIFTGSTARGALLLTPTATFPTSRTAGSLCWHTTYGLCWANGGNWFAWTGAVTSVA